MTLCLDGAADEGTRMGTENLREFDLVLYGATGFVGKLTAEYLVRAAPSGARTALAGRSQAKLAKVHSRLGHIAEQWGSSLPTSPIRINSTRWPDGRKSW